MIAFFLLLIIVAIALGIVGVVAKGLLFLLFIGIVVFLGAFIFLGARWRRRRDARRRPDR
jgi:membrane protein implicated in regulation of membrane protease activity